MRIEKGLLAVFAFLALFIIPLSGFAKNYETASTGNIGGVTLFDSSNPLIGLNSPALIVGYGKLETDFTRAVYDPRAYLPRYGFGRLYLPSIYAGANLSEDAVNGLEYFMPIIQSQVEGLEQSYDLNFMTLDLVQLGKILSLGTVDLSPLFTESSNTNTSDIVRNTLEALRYANSPGAFAFFNLNLLSYYRNNFGFSIYASSEVLAGFYGDNRELLLISDPSVDLETEAGIAVTVGFGEKELPLIGEANIGAVFKLRAIIEGHADSIEQAIDLYDDIRLFEGQITNATTVGGFLDSLRSFGENNIVKGGIGLSCDLGIYKDINDNLSVAGKLSDIISPIYWLSGENLGWKLPDLSLGLKYRFNVNEKLWMIFHEPTFYFQADDLFYTYPKSFLAKLHMGFDFKTIFDVYTIGVGLNSGYPTLGFTLHITPAIMAKVPVLKYLFYVIAPATYFNLKWNFTLYGKELGRYPGEFGFEGYNTGVELYIGI